MHLQTPENRHDLDAGFTPLSPADRRDVSSSRLGSVIAAVGLGLLMVGTSDALGRTGHLALVVPLFLAGLACIFAPCAWRLIGTAATRTERVWVSVVLGVGLLASYTLRSPLIFDNFDELAHSATLMRLLDSRSIFPNNSVLPVSPYFPGIELGHDCRKMADRPSVALGPDDRASRSPRSCWCSVSISSWSELVRGSSRAGGIGVLVMQQVRDFYSLGAQYGYQTIALTFAIAVIYLLFVSIDVRTRTEAWTCIRGCHRLHCCHGCSTPRHRMAHHQCSSWRGRPVCASSTIPGDR